MQNLKFRDKLQNKKQNCCLIIIWISINNHENSLPCKYTKNDKNCMVGKFQKHVTG